MCDVTDVVNEKLTVVILEKYEAPFKEMIKLKITIR